MASGFVVRYPPATRGDVARSQSTVPRLCRPRGLRIDAVVDRARIHLFAADKVGPLLAPGILAPSRRIRRLGDSRDPQSALHALRSTIMALDARAFPPL